MNFGLNQAPAIEMLREELAKLLDLARGGGLDYTRAKIPFSVFITDFQVNEATLTAEHLNSIDELAQVLLTHRPLEIDIIIGRASQTGNDSHNVSLSEARARAVLEELTRLHIYPPPPEVGLGATDPIQDIPQVESELNRSVEIVLWYDLSYHFANQSSTVPDSDHPAEFWRSHLPGSRYDRSALIVQLVYDNIDDLFLPAHATTTAALNAMTAWQDDDLVRARSLLGYYKQTGSDARAINADIAAFNQLLRDQGLAPSDFTGEEISDAEHFVTAAVLTMVPMLGLALGPSFSLVWEGGQGVVGSVRSGNLDSLKYNLEQLIGADMAGVSYGIKRTFNP